MHVSANYATILIKALWINGCEIGMGATIMQNCWRWVSVLCAINWIQTSRSSVRIHRLMVENHMALLLFAKLNIREMKREDKYECYCTVPLYWCICCFVQTNLASATVVHVGRWLINHRNNFCCERLSTAIFNNVHWLGYFMCCVTRQQYYYSQY